MTPDLGKYGDAVMSAYGVAIVMLVVLVVLSLRANTKSKQALEIAEEKVRNNGK